ncbi:MAG: L-serine ammonia-lyase, iron-sulfur-dependent, subunit alpha [Oscillospiraceae bacterium]
MYNTISGLLSEASGKSLPDVIMENEIALTGATRDEITNGIKNTLSVMKQSAEKALTEPLSMAGNLIKGQAFAQYKYAQGSGLCGKEDNLMLASAFSCSEVNASMGRICAAPTAGACGILPSVLFSVKRRLNLSEDTLISALLVASGFGAIITKNATVSGAEGGCQAECGTAAAMASAAAVYLAGGTNEMCAEAVGIVLINCMGLICDPVAGLVQLPCSFRNASQSMNAISSADMALAGQKSVIPTDEVITAMYRVGKSLPSDLRETANGGIAATPTAKAIASQLQKG